MTNPRPWPARLRMARVPDSPSWFVSVCDTPPQPDDREYVLADSVLPDAVRATLSDVLDEQWADYIAREYRGEQVDADAWQRIRDAQHWLATVDATEPVP